MLAKQIMITYRDIEISLINGFIETGGLYSFITKEIRVTIGKNQPENYIEIITSFWVKA